MVQMLVDHALAHGAQRRRRHMLGLQILLQIEAAPQRRVVCRHQTDDVVFEQRGEVQILRWLAFERGDELRQKRRVHIVGRRQSKQAGAVHRIEHPRAAEQALGSIRLAPNAVGTMALPLRINSSSPVRPRRRRSAPLTAGWVEPRRMAARDTFDSVSTVCRNRMRCRSMESSALFMV